MRQPHTHPLPLHHRGRPQPPSSTPSEGCRPSTPHLTPHGHEHVPLPSSPMPSHTNCAPPASPPLPTSDPPPPLLILTPGPSCGVSGFRLPGEARLSPPRDPAASLSVLLKSRPWSLRSRGWLRMTYLHPPRSCTWASTSQRQRTVVHTPCTRACIYTLVCHAHSRVGPEP
jgi:hypothetical protein